MKKIIFKDKYPVFTQMFLKKEIKFKTVDEIIDFLKAKVENHPFATFITVFDHLKHTKSLKDGTFAEDLTNAKNLLFCFGKEIPVSHVLAVRPRSIGVSEFNDRFEICFLEAPKDKLQTLMESWIEELKI